MYGVWEDYMWQHCHNDDLWIYDKLILSRKLGYVCGPVDVDVPQPGHYIVRPCVNVAGMGRDAMIEWIEKDTQHLPAGHFWCEMFEGRQLSVDYVNKKQGLTTEGFRDNLNPLWKFDKWKVVNDKIKYPKILNKLKKRYKYINCEFIDNKLIEVHLRINSDMGEFKEVIPVWQCDEDISLEKEGYIFVEDDDFHRKGFWKK